MPLLKSCNRRPIKILWCILECLFFTGILNGWFWLNNILTEDGYYLDTCNITTIALGEPKQARKGVLSMLGIMGSDEGFEDPLYTVYNGRKVKCVYQKVLKVISVQEYEKMKVNSSSRSHLSGPADQKHSIHSIFCDKQIETLKFVVCLVVIIRNVFVLPTGVFLDRFGTIRSRIVAM